MSYVETALTDGESVAYRGRLSLWSLSLGLFSGILSLAIFCLGAMLVFFNQAIQSYELIAVESVSFAFFGLGIVMCLGIAIKYYSTELVITNKRLIAKSGFMSRSTIEISLQWVESIQVDQTLWGRVFDFGSIIISGAGNPQAPVLGISRPMEFRRAFIAAQEEGGNGGRPGRVAITHQCGHP